MDDIRRANLQNAGAVGDQASGAAADAVKEGSYRGERVVEVPTQAALIQEAFEDSLEELTATVGEKEEKDLSRREIRSGKRADLIERVMKAEEIQQLVERLHDLPKEDLAKAVQQLLQSKDATARQLGERARQSFEEPAHQYAALRGLLTALREQGAPAERIAAAEGAIRQLMEEHGAEVRAGLNVSPAAAEAAASGLGAVQDLRSTYRDAVLDYQGLAQALDSLTSKYKAHQLPAAIQFLQKGLAADLATQGASIDKSKLNAILNDMYRLEVLSTMLERANDLVEKTKKRGAVTAVGGDALLKEVLAWQDDKWLSPEKIAALPGKLGIRDAGQEITFLTDFKELVRAMPERAFKDPDQKLRMLDAIQLSLDGAIDREEETE